MSSAPCACERVLALAGCNLVQADGMVHMVICRSRLGCQVIAAKELDGLRVRIPSATRNFAVDG